MCFLDQKHREMKNKERKELSERVKNIFGSLFMGLLFGTVIYAFIMVKRIEPEYGCSDGNTFILFAILVIICFGISWGFYNYFENFKKDDYNHGN